MKYICIIFLFIISACREKVSSLAEYQDYLRENSSQFTQIQETDLFKFSLQYLPPTYQAMQQLEVEEEAIDPNSSKFAEIVNSYEEIYAFQWLIEPRENDQDLRVLVHQKATGIDDYSAQINNLNFELPKHIFLIQDEQKIQPLNVLMENTLDKQNKMRFLIVFPKPELEIKSNNIKVLIDNLFFQSGTYTFSFNLNRLRKLPEITTN